MGLLVSGEKDKVLSATEVSKESMREQMDTSKSSKSPGPDGRYPRVLMGFKNEVAEWLANM